MSDFKERWRSLPPVDKGFVVVTCLWVVGLATFRIVHRPVYNGSFIYFYVGAYALLIVGFMFYKWLKGERAGLWRLGFSLLLAVLACVLLFSLHIFVGS